MSDSRGHAHERGFKKCELCVTGSRFNRKFLHWYMWIKFKVEQKYLRFVAKLLQNE